MNTDLDTPSAVLLIVLALAIIGLFCSAWLPAELIILCFFVAVMALVCFSCRV